MPYISEDRRQALDPLMNDLFNRIRPSKCDGELNYFVQKFALRFYGQSYTDFCRFNGTLVNSILEYYRRVVAPYEDYKRDREGDVY